MASGRETIFTMEATPVKYGTGASAEAGWELARGFVSVGGPGIFDGALAQQRLLAVAPKDVSGENLRHIITASMTN